MNFLNQNHLEGILYEHDLQEKVSGPTSAKPGTQYITGTISIATDEEMLNVVPVHFTYVTPLTAKGSTNATYTLLKNIYDGNFGTYMKDGIEKAVKLRVDTSINLNEFYSDRDGQTNLVSNMRNEGGFVHLADSFNEDVKARNKFYCDMIITKCARVEANEELDLPEKVVVKGVIFDFRKAILPVEFISTSPGAMDYFEGLEATEANPTFIKVWGTQVSETVKKQVVTESAFGEADVRTVPTVRKNFVITGAGPFPYEWDDESTITKTAYEKACADRELYLATLKQRQEEYAKNKQNNTATTPVTQISASAVTDDFNF